MGDGFSLTRLMRPCGRPVKFGIPAALFMTNWPEGTTAHLSYFRRISAGPAYTRRRSSHPLKWSDLRIA
jgi:hypothetical protein